MAVQPDRGERVGLDPWALGALADAARAAARGARIGEVADAVVAAAGHATGAPLVVARILDAERRELVTRAVASSSAALAAELDGGRVDAAGWPEVETEREAAPEVVRALAARIGADDVLLIPVIGGDEQAGTLELYAHSEIDEAGVAAARLAAAQLGLAISTAIAVDRREAIARYDAFGVAGDAFAVGTGAEQTELSILRLALTLTPMEGAALWRLAPNGEAVPAAAIGSVPELPTPVGVQQVGSAWIVTEKLGELGLLQFAFADGRLPSADLFARLQEFADGAACALRESERTRAIAAELERTRALLAVVGQASAELSLSHALETAIERVSELSGVDRLAIYLLEDGRLTSAAERGLVGPHARVAEALLELGLGPFRGRGVVALADAAGEPRLRSVVDAVAEAGIEAAIALPLVAGGNVTGLLAVYPPYGRAPRESEATLFAALADRLAVAVENARLHEQATRLGRKLEHALTSERAAAKQLRALYEISKSFSQSLSLDVTLQSVARTAVELLEVDAAVLRMPDPRGEQLIPFAMYVADERLIKPVRALLFRSQPLAGPLRRLFRDREPILLRPDETAAAGGSHAVLAPFLEKGSTAAIVPIATPSEVLASLTLLSVAPDRPIGSETIEAALGVGGQAALAIDNARLYQQRKDFAEAMRRSLLPQVRPPVAGLDIGVRYAPSAAVDVGGDLYDYLVLDDGRFAVVLGDVTGHGVDAAADMAMAKYVFRSLAREHPEPAAFLTAANRVVVDEIAPGKFITMVSLVLDPATGRVTCASAGHPPPRLIDADGAVRAVEARGLALGIDPEVEFVEVQAEVGAGAAVVLYTDGVIEARRGTELYGTERLDALLERRRNRKAPDIAGSVVEAASKFAGGKLLDDCAVVVLKRTP